MNKHTHYSGLLVSLAAPGGLLLCLLLFVLSVLREDLAMQPRPAWNAPHNPGSLETCDIIQAGLEHAIYNQGLLETHNIT